MKGDESKNMANVRQFIFFDESSAESISNPFGNYSSASALTLQVDDLGSGTEIGLSVEGAADMNLPENYFPIKVISLETFKTINTITKAGLYMCVIDGIAYVRIKNESASSLGNFKAYAVSVS